MAVLPTNLPAYTLLLLGLVLSSSLLLAANNKSRSGIGSKSDEANASSSRVLVLIDSPTVKETHSDFFKSLEQRGHQLEVKPADDSSLALFKFGRPLYEHLILFAPAVEEFGGSINVAEIAKFIDSGGNVLVAASSNLGEAIRDLATEVGFEFDEAGTAVIDHHNYDAKHDDGYHTTVVVPSANLIGAELIAGARQKIGPVLFRGVALVSDAKNPLRLEVLTADTTAYSFDPRAATVNSYPAAVGRSTILVGALQARNNARVVLTGSLDLFSNAFLQASVQKAGSAAAGGGGGKSGNADLVSALSKWVFKEVGVLRAVSVDHHKVGEVKPPHEYTIMEDVSYEIVIEELKEGKWLPFQGKDVQLEFVRIDPFVRTTLANKNGKLTALFKIPDVYGVYKFLVDYRRVGYTHLYDVRQVSVRPLQHTQYERFSPCAYPYYVSAFSMMLGVVLFSFIFLYHKDSAFAGSSSAAGGVGGGDATGGSGSKASATPSSSAGAKGRGGGGGGSGKKTD